MTKECAELIARCFAARTQTHLMHLQSRSYSAHMALGEFYEAIGGVVDTYAECYQSHYGIITDYPVVRPVIDNIDPVVLLKNLREWIAEHRALCASDETELGNLVDEILSTIDQTIYKLRFLR